uniref:Major facilitator superfamily (MFS) profile domain-containing protein n=1 Tax=Tetradesmus obliquus TaxID=3088 RepID=A0A383VWL9_TETOB|eukprot:jgi/Sobl393_1/12399/SZX69877.1
MVFGSLAVLGGVLTIFMPETLGAAMPENAEDLDDLLSPFTAKPWRRGILALFAFIFRTKAAYAYKTYQCRECRAHTCTCFNEALLDAAAAAAAGEAAGGEAAGGMGEVIDGANESQDDFDDGVAGTGVSGSAELGGGNACDDASASASADEAAAVVRGTAGSSTSAAATDDSSGKSIAIE